MPRDREVLMPTKKTVEKARRAKRAGKSPGTQAGEFVREEIEHIREGRHGARSARQAIAIGLSKARRAGVRLEPPEAGTTSEETRKKARADYKKGQSGRASTPSARRSRASKRRLEREGTAAASKTALSRHARAAARTRKGRKQTRKAAKKR